MTRRAVLVRLEEARDFPVIAVPVHFDGPGAFISEAIVASLPGRVPAAEVSREWCDEVGLKAEPGSSSVLRGADSRAVVLVASGPTLNEPEHYRLAGAAAVRAAKGRDVAFLLPTGGVERPDLAAAALVEGGLLASYRYRDEDASTRFALCAVGTPLPSVEAHDAVATGLGRGAIVGESVNWAKRLIDTPANLMTPSILADAMVERFSSSNVQVTVWDDVALRTERCGGVLGVSQGSAHPPRLVRALYDPEPGAPMAHVALVGKGVTFDSGGLSLKSPLSQMTMKTDMTGAAVVMSCLDAVARLGLRVRVSAFAPMAENVVGSRAMKPGDVLVARNGTSVEVTNTDAEGRLLLADAISLAAESEPDAIVDVATLTGAQVVAVGKRMGALFTSTDELARLVGEASEIAGEALWRLPIHQPYNKMIESEVADVVNVGPVGQAGAIVAALFLERFTGGLPWAHLDIAGPARAEDASGYTTKGATAFGARTVIEFLSRISAA